MELIEKVITLVLSSGSSGLTKKELDEAGGDLMVAGYDSISFTNMLVSIENEFGIPIDTSIDPELLTKIDGIVEYIKNQSASS